MNNISCPYCHKEIILTDALASEIESEILIIERKKHEQELENAVTGTSRQLKQELELLRTRLEEKNQRLKLSEEAELNLRKEKIKLQEEQERFEIEKSRELDREREAIRKKAIDEAEKRSQMEKMELEKKISDLKKSLEDAQRKATQSSQQLQGEVQELNLEELLRKSFPTDNIEPIGKGVTGADIRQVVRTQTGLICGTILWESKRTKTWSDAWVSKLKQDLIQDKADIPGIITSSLPQEASSGIGFKDGIWIASFELALMLSALLRSRLLEAARQKQIVKKQQSKAEQLYGYVTSHDFQHQVESMLETYQEMRRQVDRERASYERNWKMREMQISRLVNGVAGVYGSIQGIAEKALPPIAGLDYSDDDAS
jgi:hypothetical protein